MRRSLLLAVSVIAAIAVASLFSSSSPAGGQAEGQFASFEIIKDVHGDGPTTGFVIEYSCDDGDGGVTSDSLDFEAEQTQVINVSEPSTCTITETNTNGADLVEYECEFFPGLPPTATDEPAAEGRTPGSCLDGQTFEITTQGDFASLLVRNTFEADVLPDVDEPPAVTPDVVTATPSFTG